MPDIPTTSRQGPMALGNEADERDTADQTLLNARSMEGLQVSLARLMAPVLTKSPHAERIQACRALDAQTTESTGTSHQEPDTTGHQESIEQSRQISPRNKRTWPPAPRDCRHRRHRQLRPALPLSANVLPMMPSPRVIDERADP